VREWKQLGGRTLLWLSLAGIFVIWLANLLGWWWLASLIGLVLGLVAPTGRGMITAGAAGAGGWALGLLWVAIHDPIVPTAQALTITLGMGTSAAVSIFVTILMGAILAASAAWLGRALRSAARPRAEPSRSSA
jgi:hypothetical protein